MDTTKTNVRELQADLERAAKQAGKCELGRRVHEALHNDTVQWPPVASKALTVPKLHPNVRTILIEMAALSVQGKGLNSLVPSLSHRMDRYHSGWR